MPKPLYVYEPQTRRFRNRQTGRFLSPAQMDSLRVDYLRQEQAVNEALAKRLFAKAITATQFAVEFKGNLNRVYATQYMIAKGGKKQMAPSDYGILGAQLKKQHAFVDGFVQKIVDGGYTVDEMGKVVSRMNLYLPPSEQAYQRGELAAAYPGLRLSNYPRDGKTICSFGCGCDVSVVETDSRYLVTWNMDPAKENCPDCQRLAREWNPLVVPKQTA